MKTVYAIDNPLEIDWGTFFISYFVICYFLQYEDTPIHLASSYGHLEVVEKLISLGADINVADEVSANYYSVTKCLLA